MKKIIETAVSTYKMADVTIKTIQDFKKAEKLECKDTKSRQVIGKHRKDIKSLIAKVDRKRKDNNNAYQEKNNGIANVITIALVSSRDVFDTKIKEYDVIAAEKKAEKERLKKEAAEKIDRLFTWLNDGITAGIGYGLESVEIEAHLEGLKSIQLSSVDYGERIDDAEITLMKGIQSTQVALIDRIKHEKEAAEQARIRAEQEAESKRLADIAAKQKAEQEKEAQRLAKEKADFEAEQKAIKEEADRKAAAEKKKTDEAAKKLREDREALEKEKADIADEKQREADRIEKVEILFEEMFYSSDPEDDVVTYLETQERLETADEKILKGSFSEYKEALLDELTIMRNYAHNEALIENDEWVKNQAKKLKADTAHQKLLDHDKKILQKTITAIDEYICSINPLKSGYKTDEIAQVEVDLIVSIKSALDLAGKE